MDKVNEALERGVEKIYPSRQALEKVLRSGKKIKLYQGFDPSMPSLHLGNTVGILKLRQFQDLGHRVIFLVGDFTGMIGDPTDKSAVRKKLTRKQVLENAQNYKKQAGKILRFKGENPAEIKFNSQWLSKLSPEEFLDLASHFTAAQMGERDMFQERLKKGKEVWLHEFLYPLLQAYDCVAMEVDLEVGGSDQMFNMLCGRHLAKALKSKEKYVLTTKLLVDTKGEKVGKTAGNALFLDASPTDMYGGVMSFPDEVIIPGFELLTMVPLEEVRQFEKIVKKDPMGLKKKLAFEIVKIHHGEQKAQKAQKEFERVFQKRKLPTQIPSFKVAKKTYDLIDLLVETGLAPSRSEAKRLVEQGGVDVDGEKVKVVSEIKVSDGMIVRVGKRKFVKLQTK